MNYHISVVGVVLNDKKNYIEWYRKIKRTLIFNDSWRGICEVEALPDIIDDEEVESCFEYVAS
jgi:hypothetical protein